MAVNLYVTAVALKATLTLTGETYADADITTALEAASRKIDEHCGRRFWLDADATQVRYYTPISRDLVRIDDLVTLTTLQDDPGGDGTYENTWTLNTDFVLEPYNAAADVNAKPYELITRHPRARFVFQTFYPRSVKVTGLFGWAAIPAGIVEATSILAARYLKRAREAPFGVAGLGFDGNVISIRKSDPDVADLVFDFQRRGHGFA